MHSTSINTIVKTGTVPLPPLKAVKVLDRLRERVRYLHYSIRTEEAYVYWVRAFIRFHGLRHPSTLGATEVEGFLSWLAGPRGVSSSTHRQALSALLFFYGRVLDVDLPWMKEIGRPRSHRRLPVVRRNGEASRTSSTARRGLPDFPGTARRPKAVDTCAAKAAFPSA